MYSCHLSTCLVRLKHYVVLLGKEKYKRLEATYIGSLDVTAPHGIGVVNDSVAQLSLNKSRWLPVYVDVATSHLRIVDQKVCSW